MSSSILILPKKNLDSSIVPDGKPLIDNTSYYNKIRDLISLLEDAGVIFFDSESSVYKYMPFIEGDRVNGRTSAMVSKMLGYTAEGMVVKKCNTDPVANTKWANIARFLKEERNLFVNIVEKIFWHPFLQNPNKYRAIGTGLATTKNSCRPFYNTQDDRDICWIDNATEAVELLVPRNIIAGKRKNAGIQIKVSSASNGYYVTNYFRSKPYYNLYPVVYFDLGGDFKKVRENLLNLPSSYLKEDYSLFSKEVEFLQGLSRIDIVDMMLIRGKDVDPSMHEELEEYREIFKKLASGELSLLDLTNDRVIFGLLTDLLGRSVTQNTSILTIPSFYE